MNMGNSALDFSLTTHIFFFKYWILYE